ncbi:CAAX farnesyltransferase subunit beta [Aphelenchoides besseyi]|nr:CAAX farnesyltransferase subunit beta [Aphelenchoides besseyi]KAI6237501.1 CAAX farnesyltransferase subunit beta [Aphelenchoides besseyi]
MADEADTDGANESGLKFKICDPQFKYNNQNFMSFTATEQKLIEEAVDDEFQKNKTVELDRKAHVDYVIRKLTQSPVYFRLDASRSWHCFWGLHSLRLLNHPISADLEKTVIEFLKSCQSANGGYGGGPGQIPHLATTYASVMALISIGSKEAWDSIDRDGLLKFFYANKQPNGSFTMHEGGEIDIRSVYCAVSVAVVCGIYSDELFGDSAQWIMRCRSYEGGFGGEPGCEAHGGYTYCGVAALALMERTHMLDDEALARWLVNRQMAFEGGFQGRTGKLVDACYSFWQAAACCIAEIEIQREWKIPARNGLFNDSALQQFILSVSQQFSKGGFADKPDKDADLYHTCYTLAGLSIAQQHARSTDELVGGKDTQLRSINPLLNVCWDEAEKAKNYFATHALASESTFSFSTMLKGEKWFELGYNETSEKKWNHADEIYLNQMKRAEKLLKRENETQNQMTKTNKKSEDSWLDTVVEKGTMSDRLSAIQLKFQKDPIHSLGYLERIVTMLEKNKQRDAVNLLKCVKEIMIKELLPSNRKLIAFDMRPLSDAESLSSGNVTTANKRLMLWKYEDDLKKLYQRIVIAGQKLAATPVEGVAEQVCIVLADLLIERPEQEQFLLNALVSKLGHPQRKVDVMVARQLERLLSRHPNMRMTVALELERLIFRKNMSNRARFYAIHSLTIIPLRSGDADLAVKMLKIYFSLFRILVTKKTTEKTKNSKFLAAVIRGANSAFPHAKERTSELGVELNELYKIVHEAPNLSTSLNALKLLYQMLTYNSSLSDRFYASLYQRMLRIRSSKNDTEFFRLMNQVLRSDTVDTRIRAFIKRLLQLALNSTPSFAASALILYSSLLTEKPDLIRLPRSGDPKVFRTRLSNSLCIKKEESNGFNFDDDDEEEHYEDVKLEDVKPPLNGSTKQNGQLSKKSKKRNNLGQVKKAVEYEDIKEEVLPKIVTTGWVHREKLAKSLGKQTSEQMEMGTAYTLDVRNPLFAHADMSADTEVILLSRHYHPSVAHFASCVIEGRPIQYKGDALMDFTLIRFLDRFAFKNPKSHRASEDGGGDRRGYNPKGVKQLALTSSEYANKSINEIPSDERFLHRFAALKMRAKNAAKQTKDGEGVVVKKEEPDEETMSVDSDEFERVMEKFEPGEANDFFEWDDVDFTQEFGQELNKKQAKAKRKQKKREESAANVDSDESEGEMELDSDVDADEMTDDELNEDDDDSENEMEGSEDEMDGSDGSADVEMENESSDSEIGQNYEYDVESEDDEDDFKPKRLKKIPKRGYQETDSEDEN